MRLRKRALAVLSASLFLVAGLHPSTAVAAGSGPWQIGIYEFPQCVEVQGGSVSNSAQVQLWYCGDYNVAHREWYMQEIQPGWWHIWNKWRPLLDNEPKEPPVSQRPGSVFSQWNGFNSVHLQWGLEQPFHVVAGPLGRPGRQVVTASD
jgi:hypothetical protein